MKFKLLASLILFSLGGAQRSPQIVYISENQVASVGSSVELSCSVQYGLEYTVIWLKNGQSPRDSVFLSTGTSLVVKESRFALLYDGASSTYTVLIKDLQETDAGVYQCEVVLSVNNKITAETSLSVRRPPIITDNSTQSIVTTEGQSIQMECYALGFPQPKIIWRRENNALLPTGGSTFNGNIMKIHSVNKEDRGTYYCFADNGVGKGDRRNINLEIEFSPVITLPRTDYQQALRYDIDLQCHIEAYPPPQVTWLKDEISIVNNNKYKISNFVTADEFTDSTLRIVKIGEKEFGVYKCLAFNKLGNHEAKLSLSPATNPVCPPSCGQSHNSSNRISLRIGTIFAYIMFLNFVSICIQ